MNGRAGTRAQGQGTRNRGCGVSRFKWRKDLSLSGMWAGRKIWATRRRFTNCRSGDVHDDSQLCVALFLLNRYWGIVTVPGSIPYGSRPVTLQETTSTRYIGFLKMANSRLYVAPLATLACICIYRHVRWSAVPQTLELLGQQRTGA